MRKLMFCAGACAVLALTVEAQRGRGGMGNDPSAIWGLLVKNHDKNHDGKITAAEYTRGADKFNTYDADGDGVLTEKDLLPISRGASMGRSVSRRADSDADGKVTQSEWQDFISETDANGDAILSIEEINKVFGRRGGRGSRGGRGGQNRGEQMRRMMLSSFDSDEDGEIVFEEMAALFAEIDRNGDGVLAGRELPRQRGGRAATVKRPQPPKVGDLAPDFELPDAIDPEKLVRLSSFKGEKPVALIFGSHT